MGMEHKWIANILPSRSYLYHPSIHDKNFNHLNILTNYCNKIECLINTEHLAKSDLISVLIPTTEET